MTKPVITSERGAIYVEHPTVFAAPTGTSCLEFVARLRAVPLIQEIEIVHPIGRATIRFADEYSPANVLRQVAEALRSSPAPALDDNVSSLLRTSHDREWTRIFRAGDVDSVWQMTRRRPDQLWLQHEIVSRSGHVTERLIDELAAHPSVQRVTAHEPTNSLIIDVTGTDFDESQLLQRADQIVQSATGADLPDVLKREFVGTLSRIERGLNLALAGASFGMAVVGVVVPGIPTVPFLLVTSFFLVRSSPKLNDRLRRSRVFGPMLRDWQRHRGMRWQTKATALGFMAATFSLSLLLVEVPPVVLAAMLLFGGLGAYFVLRMPTIPIATTKADDWTWEAQTGTRAAANYI